MNEPKPHCSSAETLRQRLGDWYRQAPGRFVRDQVRTAVEPLLRDLFGYHLIQLGSLDWDPPALSVSRVPHRVVMDCRDPGVGHAIDLLAAFERLPIETDVVDGVFLPHTLDFSADPHQLLREVERVLIPEGRLVIVGFNPLSLWGLWRLLPGRRAQVPWCGAFIGLLRVKDWLGLLGFDVEVTEHLMFRPPLAHHGLMNRLQFLETSGRRWWAPMGGVYVIRAVKRVSRLTPIKPRWAARRVLGVGTVEPTTRTGHG